MVLLCFITELKFDFVVKLTAIDEISNGKIRVVEQVVEGINQMQVFGQFLVKAFVPVGRRTLHTDEFAKHSKDLDGPRLARGVMPDSHC